MSADIQAAMGIGTFLVMWLSYYLLKQTVR